MSPDISMLSPELQQEWDVDRNRHLGPIKVKPHSNIKAVWQCGKCPAGQPHIWTARVASRTHGARCPYCSNRLVCLHNSLATVAPDVARFWNHSKNEKSSEQVLASATPGLSGNAQLATGNGRPKFLYAPATGWVVPNAVKHIKCGSLSRPLLKLSLLSWLSGTMNEMMPTASTQITLLLAARSWCTGSAHAVQEGSHTAGQQCQMIA